MVAGWWLKRPSHFVWLLLIVVFLLSGCSLKLSNDQTDEVNQLSGEVIDQTSVVFPIDNYVSGRTKKLFGQFIEDRFIGFHTGDDIEVAADDNQVPIISIAAGKIVYKKWAAGYGGLLIIRHQIDGEEYLALYGHLRLSSILKKVGDSIGPGETIGVLGSPNSYDTDNERKHLHFAIYGLSDINVSGYVTNADQLANWINPTDFFLGHGLPAVAAGEAIYHEDSFKISFSHTKAWAVESLLSTKVINIFSLAGDGSARQRSQILITNLDHLSSLPDGVQKTVLQNGYEVISYSAAAAQDDLGLPNWLIKPHTVSIVKNADSNIVYKIEKNPELAEEDFTKFIQSLYFSD